MSAARTVCLLPMSATTRIPGPRLPARLIRASRPSAWAQWNQTAGQPVFTPRFVRGLRSERVGAPVSAELLDLRRVRHPEEPAPVQVDCVELALLRPDCRPKTILFPSIDQLGLKQPIEVGPLGPPQPEIGICRSPLPSEWTTQIELRSEASGTWAEKRMSFPCGDQLPPLPLQKLRSIPGGVICRLPLSFTVKSASTVPLARVKTSRLPFDE
jgi:hypothetical protein